MSEHRAAGKLGYAVRVLREIMDSRSFEACVTLARRAVATLYRRSAGKIGPVEQIDLHPDGRGGFRYLGPRAGRGVCISCGCHRNQLYLYPRARDPLCVLCIVSRL